MDVFFLMNITICALAIWGLKNAFDESPIALIPWLCVGVWKDISDRVGDRVNSFKYYVVLFQQALEYISQPLFSCVKCMPSVWGTLYYVFVVKWSENAFEVSYMETALFVLAVSGLNVIISAKID